MYISETLLDPKTGKTAESLADMAVLRLTRVCIYPQDKVAILILITIFL
jgi:hypothetical protein